MRQRELRDRVIGSKQKFNVELECAAVECVTARYITMTDNRPFSSTAEVTT
jgi:hypothetical protein